MTKQRSKHLRHGQVGAWLGEGMSTRLKFCADGLQVGGGITEDNAEQWLQAGAEKVSSARDFVRYLLADPRMASLAGYCDVVSIPISEVLSGSTESAGKKAWKGQARGRCQVSYAGAT
jgi:imidazole glycerol phosphate synthase subunit HisF